MQAGNSRRSLMEPSALNFSGASILTSGCQSRLKPSPGGVASSIIGQPPHLGPFLQWGRGDSQRRQRQAFRLLAPSRLPSPGAFPTPSPPSGERDRVRGHSWARNRQSPPCAPSAPSAHAKFGTARFQALRALDDSRSAALECLAGRGTGCAFHLSPAGPGNRVRRHPLPPPVSRRCSRNRGSRCRRDIGGGI